MLLATQIIDQQVSGIVDVHAETLSGELGAGNDEPKKRSMAFLFIAAKTAFGLNDEEAFDGIVDGSNDFRCRRFVFRATRGWRTPHYPDAGKIQDRSQQQCGIP